MSRLPPLQAVAHFEAVARLGTVAAAARELSVSSSAVSHQIRSLEEAIGVSLFRRVNRRLILTGHGEILSESASQALDILRNARQRILAGSERQKLVGKAAVSFSVSWLMPRLESFVSAHPEIDLWMEASPTRTDFASELVDFDIRYGTGNWPGTLAEPLVANLAIPVARPDHPVFSIEGDVRQRLAGASLIQTHFSEMQWSDWLLKNDLHGVEARSSLNFTAGSMSVQAAEQGLGIALEGSALLLDSLTSGRLKPAFPEMKPIEGATYWLVYPRRHLQRRAMSLFRKWALEQGRRYDAEVAAFLEQSS